MGWLQTPPCLGSGLLHLLLLPPVTWGPSFVIAGHHKGPGTTALARVRRVLLSHPVARRHPASRMPVPSGRTRSSAEGGRGWQSQEAMAVMHSLPKQRVRGGANDPIYLNPVQTCLQEPALLYGEAVFYVFVLLCLFDLLHSLLYNQPLIFTRLCLLCIWDGLQSSQGFCLFCFRLGEALMGSELHDWMCFTSALPACRSHAF